MWRLFSSSHKIRSDSELRCCAAWAFRSRSAHLIVPKQRDRYRFSGRESDHPPGRAIDFVKPRGWDAPRQGWSSKQRAHALNRLPVSFETLDGELMGEPDMRGSRSTERRRRRPFPLLGGTRFFLCGVFRRCSSLRSFLVLAKACAVAWL